MQHGPTTGGTRTLRLLHLTDTHLFADAVARNHGVNTTDSLVRVLAQALADAAHAVDAILVTGDIGDDGSEAAYERFRSILARAGVPVYCLAGNHDAPARMARLLEGDGFRYGGRATLGGWALLLLDSHVPDGAFGRLDAATLATLERDLATLGDRHVLVAVHHPPMPVGSRWIDAIGLENGATLLDLLVRFPNVRAVFSGHVHQDFEGRHGAVRLFTTPSTCAQFRPDSADFALDDRPPGYRWVHLRPDGALETDVRWLTRSHPMPQGAPNGPARPAEPGESG